jgi:hypothetical protein
MAKISVITCCTAGREDFLLEAYYSLLDQTFNDWEWILQINQGFKVPQEILSEKRASLQFHDGVFIAAICRNWALVRSTAPLIAVLDDDDILTGNSLLIRKEALEKYPEAAFSFGRHRHLGQEKLRPKPDAIAEGVIQPGLIYQEWQKRRASGSLSVFPVPAAALWKKEILFSLGGWSGLSHAEDTALIMRASCLHKSVFIDSLVYENRKHQGSLTKDLNKDERERNWLWIDQSIQ